MNSITSYFATHDVVFGQSDKDLLNMNITNSANIQNIPIEKVQVGDIEMGYKMLGKGYPILFISGGSSDMNDWETSSLGNLSSNHTVIIFDNRGVGNTTIGSKPYTIQQLANDTVGLLDVLKIQKADVLGSYVIQQLTIMYPNKVNSLVLVGSSCGGKDHIPKPPELIKLQSEITNKSK